MSPSILFHTVARQTQRCFFLLQRNKFNTKKKHIDKNRVNLEWVSNGNLGDELAPVIYSWMLERKGICPNKQINSSVHLMTVGSMVGSWNFDAVIWGSGIHMFSNIQRLYLLRKIQKFDIRSVRGPVTRNALISCGHNCPEVYGDPAVLMPFIYEPKQREKKYKTSIILHYHADSGWRNSLNRDYDVHALNINTGDYKTFIDELVASEMIISSSLHGIILAETYGIPAVFLNTGGYVNEALMKYYDWYYATGRYSVKMAISVDEALMMEPMSLPDITPLQNVLLTSFPYDLWGGVYVKVIIAVLCHAFITSRQEAMAA